MQFDLDEGLLEEFLDEAEDDLLEDLGGDVARRAEADAPKLTGAGAASIHAVVGDGHVDVSWTPEHNYLLFNETGTERQPARPFLRPALDETRV